MASPAADPAARPAPAADDEAPPPPFRSWRALHALVLASLALVVVVLAALTRAYR
jgi:hypothetical protein